MAVIFSAALFASALLLFLVQPMFAKMVLPLLGGSPSVWTTCMLFFQAGLLAGYVYAHLLTTRLSIRWQAAVHAAVVLVPLVVLPFALPATPAEVARGLHLNPLSGCCRCSRPPSVLPFFALSATAPLAPALVQRRPTRLRGRSLLSLCGEQRWQPHRAARISHSRGTAALTPNATNHLGVRLRAWRQPLTDLRGSGVARHASRAQWLTIVPTPSAPISSAQRLRWLLLSFVPSGLMLAVTTFMSSDVAVVPMFWIVPLALYLLTFIIAFGGTAEWLWPLVRRVFPLVASSARALRAGRGRRAAGPDAVPPSPGVHHRRAPLSW